MNALIWSGFLLGLIGSLHCLGMCGPIAMTFAGGGKHPWTNRLLYHSGRMLTYLLIGLSFGAFGFSLQATGFQNVLAIVLGISLLVYLIRPQWWQRKIAQWKVAGFIAAFQKRIFTNIGRTSPQGQVLLGMTNGLLPCGLVYTAVAASVLLGDMKSGMVYMLLFGLGTLPMMVLVSSFFKWMPQRIRGWYPKLAPLFILLVAGIFIARGFGLGFHIHGFNPFPDLHSGPISTCTTPEIE